MNSKPIVYIVHAVDVEGPMTETIEATFERMYSYGLPKQFPPNLKSLKAIQNGSFEGINPALALDLKQVFNEYCLDYKENWTEIDKILLECISKEFRNKYCSKDGSPYLFSWFIYDHHEDFSDNPRFHEVGTHKIYDHYHDLFLKKNEFNDGNYWHYHHPSINGHALESNTCWTNRTTHETIIAKRIIDRNYYFSCFRAGLHLERNDLSHWLEMFVPFDFSARFSRSNSVYMPGGDFDWRGCPEKWGGWHPDWYDYRKEGSMKRYNFRCTDLWTYLSVLSEEDVYEAFREADGSGKSVLTYYNHDYRDLRYEISQGYNVINKIANKFPHINWKFVNALTAAQESLNITAQKLKLSYELKDDLLVVKSNIEIFGPQPFLAIKENGLYFRDNFTDEGGNAWAYKFRNFNKIDAFGVAANSPSGIYDVINWQSDITG
jgi:hypothetical protein